MIRTRLTRGRAALGRAGRRAARLAWGAALRRIDETPPARLRGLVAEGRQTQAVLAEFLHQAEGRLDRAGRRGPRPPDRSDRHWIPEIFRGPVRPAAHVPVASGTVLAPGLTLFHDGVRAELTARQVPHDGALPRAVSIDGLGFDGTFVSLVLDLPGDMVRDTGPTHLLRLDANLSMEREVEVFARLNVTAGPDTDTLVRQAGSGETVVEFDLSELPLEARRVERMWLDLIFDGLQMNAVRVADLRLSRARRAEL